MGYTSNVSLRFGRCGILACSLRCILANLLTRMKSILQAWTTQWTKYFMGHKFQLSNEWGYRICTCPGVINTGKAPRESMTPAMDKRAWESLCVSTTFSCNALSGIEYKKIV